MMYSATDTFNSAMEIYLPCAVCGERMYTGPAHFRYSKGARYQCAHCKTWVEIMPVTNATGNEVSYIGSFSETRGTG